MELEFEIFFRDLNDKAKRRLLETWRTTEEDENFDLVPLAIIIRELPLEEE